MFDIREMHSLLTELSFDCIPLRAGEKRPLLAAWQNSPPFIQWRNAPKDSNLGVRAGNGKAMFDCDDKGKLGTSEAVINWFTGLGYARETLPIVQTASVVGRHIYANFTGAMLGSRKNFVSQIGTGDFRYGAASFVVGVSSVVDGNEYKLISGNLANLPKLDLKDLSKIIEINGTDIERVSPKASRLALALMAGEVPARYKSASEAEAGLILSLINSGFSFEEIRGIFNSQPCAGHYRNKYKTDKQRGAYLWRSYQTMKTYSQNESPVRRMIAELITKARSASWGKVTDKNIFLASLEIAYNAGRLEYAASLRDLSLKAGVSLDTARAGNKRIVNAGLLSVTKPGTVASATTYSLPVDIFVHFLSTSKCEEVYENDPPKDPCINALDDAFMNGGGRFAKGRLGRRAGEIYELIYNNPMTVSEMATRTGASTKTVRRALKKMESVKDYRTGEVIEMVTCKDGKWHSNLVSLDVVSAITHTHGVTGKRIEEYRKERQRHARELELGASLAIENRRMRRNLQHDNHGLENLT